MSSFPTCFLGPPASSDSGTTSGGGGGGGGTPFPTLIVGPPEVMDAAPTPPGAGIGATASFVITVGASGRAEHGPPVHLSPRDVVSISALETNTNTVWYSTLGPPDAAKFGPRVALQVSSVPRVLRLRNLNEISVWTSFVGEGVVVEVQFAGK